MENLSLKEFSNMVEKERSEIESRSTEKIDIEKALRKQEMRKHPCAVYQCKNQGSSFCSTKCERYLSEESLNQQIYTFESFNPDLSLSMEDENNEENHNDKPKHDFHKGRAFEKEKKPGLKEKLKELPAKANHIKQRYRLWISNVKHFAFYRKYLDRLQSGLWEKASGEASVIENRMRGDPVEILKGSAQEYIRNIVHETNTLYQEIIKLGKALELKTTAEGCIAVIKSYCDEYMPERSGFGNDVNKDNMKWKNRLLLATKYKIAKILMRNGSHKIYGYTMRSMVQKGYPKPNYLIVNLFVENPEEHPEDQPIANIFSGPDSFEILANADKKAIFNVSGLTESVLSKTVNNNVINEIKEYRSHALKSFSNAKMDNKKDEAKIIDDIWEGMRLSCKELLSRKAYIIECINTYFDMILRIDKLAYKSVNLMLDYENGHLDNSYKRDAGFSRKKDKNIYDKENDKFIAATDVKNAKKDFRSEKYQKKQDFKNTARELNRMGKGKRI